MAGRDPPSVQKSGMSLTQRLQAKSASNAVLSSASSYQKTESLCRQRQRPGLAPAGDLLFLLVQAKKAKEHDPTVRDPTLRFTSLRANLRHAIRSALRQNSLCATRSAQTACRKFDDDALALFGANARSPNGVPQAQTHG